ncbi:hypothetical protein EV421DRAFT_1912141 [Armillaria borealis]|uniref:Uncharacterized protein n=1 Tax=Armillaria borealis TaxID=47425 RepID=A0AA39IVD0_9AGAR|nr:hypothetical protein EV421DRAFT_1912141 [Armillaria borealis]
MAASRRLPTRKVRNRLLHKMQAGKDVNGNPMSHKELVAEVLEAGSDMTARTACVKRTKLSSSLGAAN